MEELDNLLFVEKNSISNLVMYKCYEEIIISIFNKLFPIVSETINSPPELICIHSPNEENMKAKLKDEMLFDILHSLKFQQSKPKKALPPTRESQIKEELEDILNQPEKTKTEITKMQISKIKE